MKFVVDDGVKEEGPGRSLTGGVEVHAYLRRAATIRSICEVFRHDPMFGAASQWSGVDGKMTNPLRVLRRVAFGVAVGVVMSLPVWCGYVGAIVAGVPDLDKLYNILNTPAGYLALLWTDVLRLPPKGESAWIIVPAVAISCQWVVICIAIERCWSLLILLRRKAKSI